jgi:hypothetical protein
VTRLALCALAFALGGCATARPVTGILVLRVTPAEARVLLDDHYIGSGQQLSGQLLRLNAGRRRIEVSAEGHYAQWREADVAPDRQARLDIALHPVPDGLRGD